VQPNQTVYEMVQEVLENQAKLLVERSGQSLESALEVVCGTDAGRQLRELGHGPHGHEKARDWQENLPWQRADERLRDLLATGALLRPCGEERHHSWVEGYMEWLKGKEAREQYYELLEEELVRLKG
jgi:hypothetical protein